MFPQEFLVTTVIDLSHSSHDDFSPTSNGMERAIDELGKKLKLKSSEQQRVEIPDGIWSSNTFDHELCLVGRILSRKSVHLASLQRSLLSGWNLIKGVNIQKIGEDRLFLQFNHVVDKRKVLWQGPRAFDKSLVVLCPIAKGQDPMDVNLNECDFYVHAMGVPFTLRHRGMAEILGNSIGAFVDIDMAKSRDSSGAALRFRVCIDIMQPIRRVIQLSGPQNQVM